MSRDEQHLCKLYCTKDNYFPIQVCCLDTFTNLRNHVATEEDLCHRLLATFFYNSPDFPDEDEIDVTVEIDNQDKNEVSEVIDNGVDITPGTNCPPGEREHLTNSDRVATNNDCVNLTVIPKENK